MEFDFNLPIDLGDEFEEIRLGTVRRTAMEIGAISRHVGPIFEGLRGRAVLNPAQLAALAATREGSFRLNWRGQEHVVRLAPQQLSENNPRLTRQQLTFDGSGTATDRREYEFDLLILTQN